MLFENSLEMMNIEITTNCPLRCPQCYCSLTGGKNINFNVAVKAISDGKNLGLKSVMLSGGETLCYPYLVDLVKVSSAFGMQTHIALSGYKLTYQTLDRLVKAGVSGIYISLNGSTKEINALTRDGFDLALSALNTLKEYGFSNTTINWVMHSSNADDFYNVIEIAEKYNVSKITVMAVKPNSRKELATVPSREQMLRVRDIIRANKRKTKIMVESCFSQMLALVNDTKLFGNLNLGKHKGCGAGRWAVCVNVDGTYSPCRHLECREKFATLKEYWTKSKKLERIRCCEENKQEPCISCRYSEYCRHCLAINYKINDAIYFGNEFCSVFEKF